jgi:hypothetical protein
MLKSNRYANRSRVSGSSKDSALKSMKYKASRNVRTNSNGASTPWPSSINRPFIEIDRGF